MAKSHFIYAIVKINGLFSQDGKAIKSTDRIKITTKQDDVDKQGTQFILEIIGLLNSLGNSEILVISKIEFENFGAVCWR